MDGLALLGLFLIIYAGVVVALAIKPQSIWEMGKIRFFRKIFGEKGTVIFFYVIAVVAVGFGICLLVK